MRAAGLDDDIAAHQLRVFLDAVAGMRQMLAAVGTHQRRIFRIEVNHCVLQRHLQQGIPDDVDDDPGLHRNGLMNYLARNFERQRRLPPTMRPPV